MKQKIKDINHIFQAYSKTMQQSRIGASAAHAAYFMILSFLPMVILLLSLIQYTSLNKSDVIDLAVLIFPDGLDSYLVSLINEAYSRTAATISISAIAMAWSGGRGLMALTQGLQAIYGIIEHRSYIGIRIRAAFYTVLLLVMIIFALVVGVFGNSLSGRLIESVPVMSYAVIAFNSVKTLLSLSLYAVVFAIMYRFMPGEKRGGKKIFRQMPGAIFTSVGWYAFSYVFSIYIDRYTGFSNIYGSLTTIILVMLWLYFCMYILLLGAQINVFVAPVFYGLKKENRTE